MYINIMTEFISFILLFLFIFFEKRVLVGKLSVWTCGFTLTACKGTTKRAHRAWCKRHYIEYRPVYFVMQCLESVGIRGCRLIVFSLSFLRRVVANAATFLTSGKMNRTGSASDPQEHLMLRCRHAKFRETTLNVKMVPLRERRHLSAGKKISCINFS